ncbi:nucleoside hydrolase [Leptinotarsa decemlineata]|uniref:nucleoside hydrolase n=1 Tax=Leptinotarsa decemlineata TaxID=7539 RepID=UPI000C2544AB|nr:uncharacterized protein C1683.06c-like [Leptinotarsa decemlineata]XP_023026571.1 uncharacterized protein C1683.06c-like [Leptinotarsa decemlineata]XP_023026572.1 uncharacterized protein C1683.06c-like [Leptinotarsa decemlineata]
MRRIIVDLDVGTDDYLALLMLLNAERNNELKIEGIVCSMGNTIVENVVNNVVRLLQIVDRTDIPVYKGPKYQFILPQTEIEGFHGKDGFGDLKLDEKLDLSIVRPEPAAVGIHEIISNNPRQISLICMAPLTNLALTIKLYDDVVEKIKDVWIMGGNCTGVGNISCAAEYNFYVDPEAAYIVLECMKCPIFILPWETCLQPRISWEWRQTELGTSTPELALLLKAEENVYPPSRFDRWFPCDAILTFCYLNPDKYITKKSMHHATIELHGSKTRGQVVLNHMNNNTPNVTIIGSFDEELFKEELLKLRSRQPRKQQHTIV